MFNFASQVYLVFYSLLIGYKISRVVITNLIYQYLQSNFNKKNSEVIY